MKKWQWNSGPLLIVGPGRSGKDEAAGYLHNLRCGLVYTGSLSWFALPYVAEALGQPPQHAWEHRHEDRKFWYEHCNWLRRDDPLFLVRLALKSGNLCTGLRDREEIIAAKREGIFSRILWIERPGIPEDPTLTYGLEEATDAITNGGTLETFYHRLSDFVQRAAPNLH